MPSLYELIAGRLQAAFDTVEPGADPVLRSSSRAGVDFQANGALALAKRTGQSPPDVASRVVAAADLASMCSSVEVTPQGFVNLVLDAGFLATCVASQVSDPHLGVETTRTPRTVVVDYSSPNVAKEMAAHHLRTTIICDALCRVLGFLGHSVVRENHVGDWGTQFGMLIEHLLDLGERATAEELSVGDLDLFYREANRTFESSEEFRDRSRRRVVLLQSGDPDSVRLWRILVDQSLVYFQAVYDKLGVLLTPGDVVGESFYNHLLPVVVDELSSAGLLVESDGALCVFPEGYENREGEPLPLIVRKSDGGYGYATSDLAALRDRFGRLRADLALYVVGAPQSRHLSMCFDVASAAGYVPARDAAVHVTFGSMLGADRKMFRTRTGGTVKLVDLLDEAVARAGRVLDERESDLDAEQRADVARMVGIGAVKYADLSTDRVKDYVFDWDRMLSFDGSTAPYLQYARVRCLSIFRRGGFDVSAYTSGRVPVLLEGVPERELALALLGFPAAVAAVTEGWNPHKLCSYLYELAGAYTAFFESSPVLKASDDVRDSRLVLCALTASVLERGLGLLGIECPTRM